MAEAGFDPSASDLQSITLNPTEDLLTTKGLI